MVVNLTKSERDALEDVFNSLEFSSPADAFINRFLTYFTGLVNKLFY